MNRHVIGLMGDRPTNRFVGEVPRGDLPHEPVRGGIPHGAVHCSGGGRPPAHFPGTASPERRKRYHTPDDPKGVSGFYVNTSNGITTCE